MATQQIARTRSARLHTALVIIMMVLLAAGGYLVARGLTQPDPPPVAAAPMPSSTWDVQLDELDPLPSAAGGSSTGGGTQAEPDPLPSAVGGDAAGGGAQADEPADSQADGTADPQDVGLPAVVGDKSQAPAVIDGPRAPGAQAPAVVAPAPRGQANVLSIPALGVHTRVTSTGSANGAMIVPSNVRDVGWLNTSSALSAKEGHTILAGHVSSRRQGPGTLYDLYRIPAGAQIWTTDASGNATQWRVTGLQHVTKDHLPKELFSTTGDRKLALVTCGGRIIRSANGAQYYESNVIVTATPVTS